MNVIPTWEEIRRGDTTDIYFRRTMEVLRAAGKDRTGVIAAVVLSAVGVPDDVAGVAVFLASRLADYVNGQYIPVNGGAFMV